MRGKKWAKKIGQKVPKRAKIRFPGSGAPACVLARRASRRRLGCRPKAGKLVTFKIQKYLSKYNQKWKKMTEELGFVEN